MSAHLIRPCAECQRLTRPGHAKIADFPGTLVRRGAVCDGCRMYAVPTLTPRQERARAYHLRGLQSFLTRRNERADAMARREYYTERISA